MQSRLSSSATPKAQGGSRRAFGKPCHHAIVELEREDQNPVNKNHRCSRQEDKVTTNFTVNGKAASSDAPPATPLLWVIREGLKLTGTKFGCGAGLCGACMVHIDGKRAFSCQTQIQEVAGKSITTIEGLSPDSSHPLQKAWLAERVPQCGYCQSGQIMSAADLLRQKPKPARSEIIEHMSTNLCRCGTYPRIVRAIERAAREA
jgi:isoquinoline 1-oxidoreductase subunit alpha